MLQPPHGRLAVHRRSEPNSYPISAEASASSRTRVVQGLGLLEISRLPVLLRISANILSAPIGLYLNAPIEKQTPICLDQSRPNLALPLTTKVYLDSRPGVRAVG